MLVHKKIKICVEIKQNLPDTKLRDKGNGGWGLGKRKGIAKHIEKD